MMQRCSRREFIEMSGGVVGAALALGAAAPALADEAPSIEWDEEEDFVVVGSGTAIMGAIAASTAGKVVVVEKAGILGGTTLTSGCLCWVPQNKVQVEAFGEDIPAEQIVDYLVEADVYQGSSVQDKQDYVDNAARVFEWVADSFGFPMTTTFYGDYYDQIPGGKPLGRPIGWADDEGNLITGPSFYAQRIEPFIEASDNIEIMLGTEATELLCDAAGRVAGVRVQGPDGERLIGASKGVLLGAGGFERNPQMCAAYLMGPIWGANTCAGNTGDGHRMAMRVGAGFADMTQNWQCPFYIVDPDAEPFVDMSSETDWAHYSNLPGTIIVNGKGRRFMDESTPYAIADFSFWGYDSDMMRFENLPAFEIFDADVVKYYGWPAYHEEQPDWVRAYDSLEELAAGEGIDVDGLLDQVARFNAYAESGVDEEFGRGGNYYGPNLIASFWPSEHPETPNICLAPVATPPFYVARKAPGTIGTSGGVACDVDGRVLDFSGEPIEGLYACGNDSQPIFGCVYPGAGGTVGAGFYRALRAANHAFGLGILG